MVSGKGNLVGKVAIITGGGTGLGKSMALTLAEEGADIVVASRRVEPIEETARGVRALGSRALAISTDVTDSQQVNRLVERSLDEMGRLDILINNAGIVRGQERKPIWEITDEEWHLGIDTNLSGAFFCCRAVGKHLVTQKSGKVINIASGAGIRGGREGYMYHCAKGGVIQLTSSLALTWAQHNIQVNTIIPGYVDVRSLQPEERELAPERRPYLIPVGRFGVPQDIGSLGLFLASDASDYITGDVFIACGGALAAGFGPAGHAPIITLEED